jgi:hypothetical protein
MRSIGSFVRSLASATGLLLVQALESLYTRCQSQTLRAIDPDASRFARARLGGA